MQPIPQALLDAIESRDKQEGSRYNLIRPNMDSTIDNPLYNLDLRGCDLSNYDLSNLVLPYARLDDACLDGIKANGICLTEASAVGASFRRSDLNQADLSNSKISHSDFSHALLRGTKLSRVDWTDVNLRDSRLCGTDLYDARFKQCDWHGANLSGANLGWTNVDTCRVYQTGPIAVCPGTQPPPFADYLVIKLWTDHHEITLDLFELDTFFFQYDETCCENVRGVKGGFFCGTLEEFRLLIDFITKYFNQKPPDLQLAEKFCASAITANKRILLSPSRMDENFF